MGCVYVVIPLFIIYGTHWCNDLHFGFQTINPESLIKKSILVERLLLSCLYHCHLKTFGKQMLTIMAYWPFYFCIFFCWLDWNPVSSGVEEPDDSFHLHKHHSFHLAMWRAAGHNCSFRSYCPSPDLHLVYLVCVEGGQVLTEGWSRHVINGAIGKAAEWNRH